MTKELNENKELKNSTLGKVAFGVLILGLVLLFTTRSYYCGFFGMQHAYYSSFILFLSGSFMVVVLSPFLGIIALAKKKDGKKNFLAMLTTTLGLLAWVCIYLFYLNDSLFILIAFLCVF